MLVAAALNVTVMAASVTEPDNLLDGAVEDRAVFTPASYLVTLDTVRVAAVNMYETAPRGLPKLSLIFAVNASVHESPLAGELPSAIVYAFVMPMSAVVVSVMLVGVPPAIPHSSVISPDVVTEESFIVCENVTTKEEFVVATVEPEVATVFEAESTRLEMVGGTKSVDDPPHAARSATATIRLKTLILLNIINPLVNLVLPL